MSLEEAEYKLIDILRGLPHQDRQNRGAHHGNTYFSNCRIIFNLTFPSGHDQGQEGLEAEGASSRFTSGGVA